MGCEMEGAKDREVGWVILCWRRRGNVDFFPLETFGKFFLRFLSSKRDGWGNAAGFLGMVLGLGSSSN